MLTGHQDEQYVWPPVTCYAFMSTGYQINFIKLSDSFVLYDLFGPCSQIPIITFLCLIDALRFHDMYSRT